MIVQRFYTVMHWVALFVLSVGIYFAYAWAASYLNENLFATLPLTFHTGHFYLTLLVTVGVCFIVDLFFFAFHFNILP